MHITPKGTLRRLEHYAERHTTPQGKHHADRHITPKAHHAEMHIASQDTSLAVRHKKGPAKAGRF